MTDQPQPVNRRDLLIEESRAYLAESEQDEFGPLDHGAELLACAVTELSDAQSQIKVLRSVVDSLHQRERELEREIRRMKVCLTPSPSR